MTKNYKTIISTIFSTVIFFCLSINITSASDMKSLLEKSGGTTGADFKTVTSTSISENLGTMVQYLLSFLGVIFIILTIYGGFLWMTARGEDEQITKAKDIIKSSIIGLIIILSADIITYYIISRI